MFLAEIANNQHNHIACSQWPRGVGPMVGGGPGDEEAMVFVLGKREVVLFPLPRGLQQFVAGPGHRAGQLPVERRHHRRQFRFGSDEQARRTGWPQLRFDL